MNDSSILTYNGIELYQSDIDILCDEYINTLNNPEMIYTKSAVFMGLLDYIYKHSLKQIIGNNTKNDYKLFDNIFYDIYLPLCYRYNKTPTIIQFSTLINSANSYLTDVKNGIYRSDGSKVNKESHQIVKKWFNVCESALVSKTVDDPGSIGSMFLLKAAYGYKENDNRIVIENSLTQLETPEQISARHAQAMIPEKPCLDD